MLRDERLIELHRGRGAVVAVRIGGHAALAGAVHDLVDEAKQHDLPESALLALVSEAYRGSTPSAACSARPRHGSLEGNDVDPAITGESSEERERMPRGIRSQ